MTFQPVLLTQGQDSTAQDAYATGTFDTLDGERYLVAFVARKTATPAVPSSIAGTGLSLSILNSGGLVVDPTAGQDANVSVWLGTATSSQTGIALTITGSGGSGTNWTLGQWFVFHLEDMDATDPIGDIQVGSQVGGDATVATTLTFADATTRPLVVAFADQNEAFVRPETTDGYTQLGTEEVDTAPTSGFGVFWHPTVQDTDPTISWTTTDAGGLIALELIPATGAATLERSVALDATAAIATDSQRDLLRSTALAATAALAVTTQRDLHRAVGLDAAAAIAVAAESFSVLERSVSLEGTAGIATAAQRDLHRSVAIAAVASIETASQRDLQRAVGLDAAAAIAVVTQRDLQRAVELTAEATIEVATLAVHERSVALDATADIDVGHERDLQRSVALDATATIEVSGEIQGAVVVHERSVALGAVLSIEVGRTPVRDRAVALDAVAALSVASQRDLHRQTALEATATLQVLAQRDLQRSVSLDATAGIAVRGQVAIEGAGAPVAGPTSLSFTGPNSAGVTSSRNSVGTTTPGNDVLVGAGANRVTTPGPSTAEEV